jgi:VanZ family protein
MRSRGLSLLYLGSIAALVAAADSGSLSAAGLRHVPFADKIFHFILMGLLAYVVVATVPGRSPRPVLRIVLLMAVVLAEELSQLWLPDRRFELADLAADLAGISCFALLALHQPRRRRCGLAKSGSD